LLIICRHLLFLLDNNDRQRWQRIYVEGPATGTLGRSLFYYVLKENLVLYTLVKELFGSTTNILGAESGGSETLADFIIKGNETDLIVN